MPLIGYPRGWSPVDNGTHRRPRRCWIPRRTPMKAQAGTAGGRDPDDEPLACRATSSVPIARRPGDLGPPAGRGPAARCPMPSCRGDQARGRRRHPRAEHRRARHGVRHRPRPGANAVAGGRAGSEHYNLIARLLRAAPAGKDRGQRAGALSTSRIATNAQRHRGDARYRPRIGGRGRDGGRASRLVAHREGRYRQRRRRGHDHGSRPHPEDAGRRPRRTIRVALWAGEEQGLLGSRAYVQQHLAGDANAAARESCPSTSTSTTASRRSPGFYLEGNHASQIMEAWLKPFADLGVTMATLQGIGATDHLSFKAVGSRLSGGAELRGLRRPHAPHQRRFRERI